MSKAKKNLHQLKTYRKVFVEKDRSSGKVLEIEQEKYLQDGEKKVREYRITDLNALNHNQSRYMRGDAQEMYVTDDELAQMKKEAGISEKPKVSEKVIKENEALKAEIAKLKGEVKEEPKEVKEVKTKK